MCIVAMCVVAWCHESESTAGAQHYKRMSQSLLFLTAEQRSLDRVQHHVEVLAHIFGEEAQHEVAVLLEQLILTAVSTIGIGTFQVLRAIQFDHHTRMSTQQVDFHSTP